jgi:hypothetical protein
MGGGGCILIIHAIVRYKTVPTGHDQRRELEAQLRKCYSNPTIAAAVEVDEEKTEHLWTILAKEHLTVEDLDELLHGLPQYSE